MNDLVRRLCEADHPVEVALRPEKNLEALKQAIDRGYVFIKFTDTRGGTELGVRVDRESTKLDDADFGTGTGRLKIVGGLTLDYVRVKCIADIDLPSFGGTGRLVEDHDPTST